MNNQINRGRRTPFVESLESRRLMSLSVKLDYTYDTSGFFNAQSRRDVFQAAVNSVASHINDHFSAIVPSGGNSWTVRPSAFTSDPINVVNPTVPADTMIVYVRGLPLTGVAASTTPPNITASSDSNWAYLIDHRGRATPGDGIIYTPSVAFIDFGSTNSWFFGLTTSGITGGQQDFYSVAEHEFGHALGINDASSAWTGRIQNDVFTGPTAQAVYGGPVPTTTDGGGHVAAGTRFEGRLDTMANTAVGVGERDSFSRVDYAILDDLGYDVTVPPASSAKYGNVVGYAYYDANKNNQRDAGEGSFGGSIYVDANRNGKYDANEYGVKPAADGKYTLYSLPAGTVRIGQYDPYNQYTVVSPAQPYTLTVAANTTVTAKDVVSRLSSTPTAHFGGDVYLDANGNGDYDKGEKNAVGITVYLDANDNGQFDSVEKHTTTDANGDYFFTALPNGFYRVRFVLPTSTTQTTPQIDVSLTSTAAPNPTALYTRTRGATLGGFAFNDVNANGNFDAGEQKLAGRTIYLDTNENERLDAGEQRVITDGQGAWTFLNLAAGQYPVREVLGANTKQTSAVIPYPLSESDVQTGQPLGTLVVTGAMVNGAVFVDSDGDGFPAPDDTRVQGATVYIDADNDNVLDAGETRTVSGRFGLYSFVNLPNTGTQTRVRIVLPAGYAQASPAGGYAPDLAIGASNEEVNFGLINAPPPAGASASGTVFADANKNLKRDGGEAGLAGLTVYVDADNDHVLDAAEVRTTTDASGAFTFAGLTDTGAATRLRVIVPGGYGQTLPTQNYGYALNFSAGATNSGLPFGLYTQATPPPSTGTIKGVAFNDVNANGLFDGGDSLAAGKTLWVDLDDDGVKDADDPGTVSGGDGSFAFANLAAGTYHVRRSFPAGYVESSPARYITLTAGQTASGVAIGSKASNRIM